jgi:hypothetical protein
LEDKFVTLFCNMVDMGQKALLLAGTAPSSASGLRAQLHTLENRLDSVEELSDILKRLEEAREEALQHDVVKQSMAKDVQVLYSLLLQARKNEERLSALCLSAQKSARNHEQKAREVEERLTEENEVEKRVFRQLLRSDREAHEKRVMELEAKLIIINEKLNNATGAMARLPAAAALDDIAEALSCAKRVCSSADSRDAS